MSDGTVLRWVAAHLPGVDEATRADLIHTVDQTSTSATISGRLAEAVSLVGFALQSASRRGTGDHRTPMLRQGARVAALPTAAAFAALAWNLGSVPAALAGASVFVLVGAGVRLLAAAPALVAVALAVGAAQPQLVALGAMVFLIVAAGEPFDRMVCRTGALLAVVGAAVGAGVGTVWSPATLVSAVDVGGLGVVVIFLIIGWPDPRFAAAATILCASRFVTADVAELRSALAAAVTADEMRLVLARWAVMGVGVAASWALTNAAISRCLGVHR